MILTVDGQLLFIGRVDFQIKIRDRRVEIGKIEHAILATSSDISNCAVIENIDDQQKDSVIAYVESSTVMKNTITSYWKKTITIAHSSLSLVSNASVPDEFLWKN